VTSDEQSVETVPPGCKKVSETLRIVDSDSDDYEADDIPLTRVVTDPQLDVAVLKAHATLQLMPWKVGQSALLRERNAVEVVGFPLGEFRAVNIGKVVSAYDHDDYHDWEHDDFVVDALLSSGNSGSPVLAVSCKTGEPELVGVFHAAYSRGSALNVVVAIDQLRTLMDTLKRAPRIHADTGARLDAKNRLALIDATGPTHESFFPFGPLTGTVYTRVDGALVFALFSRSFPLRSYPLVVLEDLPADDDAGFGSLGRLWFGGLPGLKLYARGALDAEGQAQVARLLDAVRADVLLVSSYRDASRDAVRSRERFDQMTRLERTVSRRMSTRGDLVQTAVDLADRLSPHGEDTVTTLAEILRPPIAPVIAPTRQVSSAPLAPLAPSLPAKAAEAE